MSLEFDSRFDYEDMGGPETRTYRTLVARTTTSIPARVFASDEHPLLEELERVVLVGGFATNWPTVCRGWTASDPADHVEHHRVLVVTSQRSEGVQRIHDGTITLSKLHDFMRVAPDRLRASPFQRALTMALHALTPRSERTLESKFLTMFAALEGIIAEHRETMPALHSIDPRTWSAIRGRTKKALSEAAKEAGLSKETREWMYEKLAELNRPALRRVWTAFSSAFPVDLADLWPLFDRTQGASLSDVRNRLAHGVEFSHHRFDALFVASEHLRWTLSRVVLSVLGWPIEDSQLTIEVISREIAHGEWRLRSAELKQP